ncbi:SnoaL-like polyketide cyclase [Thermomonospora echinospora]|uniref:SnoaL-like polyketide cyclase n=1 Tax=Thermomonospora echinospora TaxID=1992 RepID=A0A1H5XU21_9ACTN|nr:ester cyclase [Thermomonospora echinospora]SEG15153.1 SnoaL-like polyketide cyclase [Thermomonospora echinospora]
MIAIADLYRRWLGELWQGDLKVLHELCAPDFIGHWPDRDVRGVQEAAEQIGRTFTLFDKVATTIEVGPLVDGDLVSAHWTFAGDYRGGLPGATAAPGTRVSFTGMDMLRVTDGRFKEYWVVSDALGLMTRLGVFPS